ncbi:MAG: hypothetical protein ACI37Q_04840 [Candidatus Gastranaerophilaceae bacterium]
MSINATTSSASSSSQVTTSSAAQVNSTSSSDNAKKSSTDSSFKDEMSKVSSKDTKAEDNAETKTEAKTSDNSEFSDSSPSEKNLTSQGSQFNETLEGNIEYSKFASMSMIDVNAMLQDDIQQMASREMSVFGTESSSSYSKNDSSLFTNSISMTESDADFFINLTNNNDVSMQNITTQAQNLVNQGADVKEVKQNMQISETLLNAINTAKENNQPLRIDFDQNVSVILRVNKDGVISANFIPGDKAVEQYLKNNIDNLKATFNENDLPYTDLSYSNRGKQQQKENRRNNR